MTPSYSVCLEEMEEHWIAHVPALLGCFASADDRDSAVAMAPATVIAYFKWRRGHGDTVAVPMDCTCLIDEIQREWSNPLAPDNITNAFFATDTVALTAQDVAEAQQLLQWSRADLLNAVTGLTDEVLDCAVEGEWSIRGILNHTAHAEWWYLDRLGLAFPHSELTGDVLTRLEHVRRHLLEGLPQLINAAQLATPDGEHWTPRKLLRRALWHERDHTQHVLQFRARLGV